MSSTPSDADETRPPELPDAIAQHFAWYGKLPGAGDFVSRRMPYPVQQFWDKWCADGMDALKAGSAATGLTVWGGTPKWAFVLPAQPEVSTGQLGVFSPSCDRVGRIFPFVVSVPLVPGQQTHLLDRAALLALTWAQVVSQAQATRVGIEALDAALLAALARTLATEPMKSTDDDATLPPDINPSSLPWPDLSSNFDLDRSESYWWSVPPRSTGFRFRMQIGLLNTSHFLELCR